MEIKFRAWDKIEGKYTYNGILDNGDILVIYIDGIIGLSDNDTYKPEDFILEQYSGLKDIFTDQCCYENDLIDWYDRHKDKIIRFKVILVDGCFYGEKVGCPSMRYQLSILLHRTMHSEAGNIIGNIREAHK